MAVAAYMYIESIKGEAQDAKYHDHIELESFSFGANNPSRANLGTGQAGGKPTCNDFVITKYTDLSTPLIFQLCAQGKHITKAYVVMNRAGAKSGELEEFLRLDFDELIVSSYRTGGGMADGGTPSETISFNFAKVHVIYNIVQNGEKKGHLAAGYDVRETSEFEDGGRLQQIRTS
ncbi:MAG: type VI secretion system tube protein Hcp [Acidobacteria bacterium]|nr:type VI secretion system tube protein Hcp [Acidobacteriota bacterium]